MSAALKRAGYSVRVLDLNRDIYLLSDQSVKDCWREMAIDPLEKLGLEVLEKFLPHVMR